MSHLGHQLSALIDNELGADERDRVLVHLARCASCREDAAALRMLKRRMSALGDAAAASDLTFRLMELARPGSASSGAAGGAWPRADGPEGQDGNREIRIPWFVALGFGAVAIAGIGAAAFVAGAQSPAAPRVTPAVDSYLVQHDYMSGVVPVAAPRRTAGHQRVRVSPVARKLAPHVP